MQWDRKRIRNLQTWTHTAFAIFILTMLALGLQSSRAEVQAQQSVQWLHTCGSGLCDQNGQPFELYGPNFTGGDCTGLGLADIQRNKALGFNSIRVMIPWRRMQPNGPGLNGVNEGYFTGTSTDRWPLFHGVDEVVNWIVQENVYLIITTYWSEWEGPPSWAFPQIQDDSARYAALVAGTATNEMNGLMNLWKYIANRYKNVPNVVFELFNEPNVLDTSLAGSGYKAFNEKLISAIESAETQSHLKIVEFLMSTPGWEEIVDGATDLQKANIAWAFHYYAPMTNWDPSGSYWHESFTWLGQNYPQGWGNGTTYILWRMSRVADKVTAWNKPLLITEFAKDTTKAHWREWYEVVLNTAIHYRSAALIPHEYAGNSQYNVGYNINNPTTQDEVLGVLRHYFGSTPYETSTTSANASLTTSETMSSTMVTSETTTVQTTTSPTTIAVTTTSTTGAGTTSVNSTFVQTTTTDTSTSLSSTTVQSATTTTSSTPPVVNLTSTTTPTTVSTASQSITSTSSISVQTTTTSTTAPVTASPTTSTSANTVVSSTTSTSGTPTMQDSGSQTVTVTQTLPQVTVTLSQVSTVTVTVWTGSNTATTSTAVTTQTSTTQVSTTTQSSTTRTSTTKTVTAGGCRGRSCTGGSLPDPIAALLSLVFVLMAFRRLLPA